MIGIYKITNNINGKIYIGQSVRIETRWKEHIKGSGRNKNSVIHRAIIKHGIENFTFSVLIECETSKLDMMERYFIRYYDSMTPNGYNVESGGKVGYIITEELKQKISKNTKIAMNTPEIKAKSSLGGKSHKGKKYSRERVEKVASANRGKKRTKESKQKMANAKNREIEVLGLIYPSIKIYSEINNIPTSTARRQLKKMGIIKE